MSDYFETFGAAMDAIYTRAYADRGVFTNPEFVQDICSEPLNYGQTRTASFQLTSLKGKPTRKYFHASIYRMDSGRYELTTYTL